MPITRKHFELGIDTKIEQWMKKIHSFLTEHKDAAFTADELWKTLYGEGPWLTWEYEAFEKALDKLVEVEAAEKRLILDVAYYSLGSMPLPI